MSVLKRLAGRLPPIWQHELKRRYFQRQIAQRRFRTDEKEYGLLGSFLRPGDWALDIGANVGHYTLKLSDLVGPLGRVIAIEPVPETFSLLSANARLFPHANVSLLNLAASDQMGLVNMELPNFADGPTNYYEARLTAGSGGLTVLSVDVDALPLPHAIRVVKIDVEGHELAALRGMTKLLQRDHPVLIVETSSSEAAALIANFGYTTERLPGSSNLLCKPLSAEP